MKTMALTYGDGHFTTVREQVVARFRKLNPGIATRSLGPEDITFPLWHGTWAKLFVWDLVPSEVDRVICFDCDMIPMSPLTPFLPEDDVPFAAVPDIAGIREMEAASGAPEIAAVRCYYNAGFFVAHRSTEPMFRKMQAFMPAAGKVVKTYRFFDQTPLNLVVDETLGDRVTRLPPQLNWLFGAMGPSPKDVCMLHFAGWGTVEQRVAFMDQQLRRLEVTGTAIPEKNVEELEGVESNYPW